MNKDLTYDELLKENKKLKKLINSLPKLADGKIAIPGNLVYDEGCKIVESSPIQAPYIEVCIRWITHEGHTIVDGFDGWYSSYKNAKNRNYKKCTKSVMKS